MYLRLYTFIECLEEDINSGKDQRDTCMKAFCPGCVSSLQAKKSILAEAKNAETHFSCSNDKNIHKHFLTFIVLKLSLRKLMI